MRALHFELITSASRSLRVVTAAGLYHSGYIFFDVCFAQAPNREEHAVDIKLSVLFIYIA